MTVYNLPDQRSKEWYSSPLYPAVFDLDGRMGKTSAAIAALQAAVIAAQAAADAANAVKPYWHGYLATDASIATGATFIVTTWTQDATVGGFSYSAGILTLPATPVGRWRVTAVLGFNPNATGGRLSQVYPGASSGSPLITGGASGNANRTATAIAVKTIPLAASAVIRVQGFQDSGATIAAGGSAGKNISYFQVEYVGPN